MTVTVIGEVSIGAAVPGVQAALATSLADIEARLAACAAFQPTEPDLQASLQLATDMVANLTFAISVGITPPGIDAQIAIIAALVAALELQLQILFDLKGLFAAAVHMYRYDGPTGSFGTDMQAELSGGLPGGSGSDTAFALTLIATAPASITALQSVFKTSA